MSISVLFRTKFLTPSSPRRGKNRKIAPLIGKYVYYRVDADGFDIREAKPKEVEAHFVGLRPSRYSDTGARPFRPKDSPARRHQVFRLIGFWSETANVATMRGFGFPEGTVPDGFGMPFYFYDEFMKHNNFYAYVETLLKDSAFRNDYDTKTAELKKFREHIEDGEMPAWMMDALADAQKSFPEGTSIRCRSSTNNEDLPNFSGAGLYDSVHAPAGRGSTCRSRLSRCLQVYGISEPSRRVNSIASITL